MSRKDARAARKNATDTEKGLSGNLIVCAVGLLGTFIWASLGVLDKLTPTGFGLVFLLGGLAALALVVSAISGGWGIFRGVRPGAGNAFDVQAWAGIVAIFFLLLAPLIAAFNLKPDAPDLASVNGRITGVDTRITAENAALSSRIDGLQNELRDLQDRQSISDSVQP